MATLKLFPGGDFTVSFIDGGHLNKIKPTDYDRLCTDDTDFSDLTPAQRSAILYTRVKASPVRVTDNSQDQRATRGTHGISSHGKRTVKAGCYLLEQKHHTHNLTFLTCTIPDIDPWDWYAIAVQWPEICRQFIQGLRRELQRHGLSGEIVYVTEIQEQRFHRDHVPAYHLHLAFWGRRHRYQQWAISKQFVTELWARLISKVVGYDCDFTYATRIESVRKSARSYMGKYMSKGVATVRELQAICGRWAVPSTWYGCSQSLRRRIRQETLVVKGETVARFSKQLPQWAEQGTVQFYQIQIEDPRGGYLTVGVCGSINDRNLLKAVSTELQKHKPRQR